MKNFINDIHETIKAIKEKDPSIKNTFEIIFFYQGFHAILWHKLAHFLYRKKLYFLAKLISTISKFFTGIEIHPGAQLGKRLVIDHGVRSCYWRNYNYR